MTCTSFILLKKKTAGFKMKLFVKTGAIVMTILLVGGIMFKLADVAIATSTNSDRKLPIYCVDRQDKKIALSFDAAWGDYHYGQIK